MNKSPLILAIESSCDETGASVYQHVHGVRSNTLFSQIDLHKQYGGVVPEIASRSHLEKINGVVQQALDDAHVTLSDIDIIAVTTHPGLPGSLLVGMCFAKALAACAQKKIIGINHIEGHLFSSCITQDVPFPHVCLVASGGHTALYLVHDFGHYECVGHTLDDAAGEAFDKIAKMLMLPYPGGPAIEKLGESVNFQDFFNYPRSKLTTADCSFSGLKTAVLYDLVKRGAYDLKKGIFLKPDDTLFKAQVASSLLNCVADTFIDRLRIVYKQYHAIQAVTFTGGVACNNYLRDRLRKWCDQQELPFIAPDKQYCTDNAAMIALVAHYKAQRDQFDTLELDLKIN